MANIGFIGTGTMGASVAEVVAAGAGDCQLLFSNRSEEKAEALAQRLYGAVSDNDTIAAECDLIFLGVKPQVLGGVLQEIAPVLRGREDDFCLVSMAAGVNLKTVQALAGGEYEVIRMMPNLPLSIGSGVVQYCGTKRNSRYLRQFGRLMSDAGVADLIQESMMDSASALSGCGPAFCAMFLEALADGGVLCGLPREKAIRYAAQTMVGTGEMMLQLDGLSLSGLKDRVCSPGGASICGVAALEKEGLRSAGIQGVLAAYEATKKLGEQ